MLDHNILYRLSPLLAVHPLFMAANPLLKLDFSQQLELLKQRRAMFEALSGERIKEEDDDANEDAEEGVRGAPTTTAETPIDLSCK